MTNVEIAFVPILVYMLYLTDAGSILVFLLSIPIKEVYQCY